jgi:hypothetical protein
MEDEIQNLLLGEGGTDLCDVCCSFQSGSITPTAIVKGSCKVFDFRSIVLTEDEGVGAAASASSLPIDFLTDDESLLAPSS